MKKIIMLTALMALALFAGGCGSGQAAQPRQVSAVEAQKMMASEKDYIIVDVRTKGEIRHGTYSEGD